MNTNQAVMQEEKAQTVALSIVIARAGGPAHVRRCLESLAPQVRGQPIEVIVPYESTEPEIGQLGAPAREVRFLRAERRVPAQPRDAITARHVKHDDLLAQGLDAARGAVLAILEDTTTAAENWCREIIAAHQLPHGVIGGAVGYAGHGALNWAIYALDFGRYQPPLREGATDYLTDVNISYKREALETVRPLWATSYNEVKVNWALARLGTVLWLRPQIVVWQDRGPSSFWYSMRERVAWGRIFGRQRCDHISLRQRGLYLIASPFISLTLIGRVTRRTFGAPRDRQLFWCAFPYLIVLACAWCVGEFLSYLTAPGEAAPTQSEAR